VSSQRGVRQGDPLCPLVFALTLQGPLQQVAQLQLAWPLAYADDTFLQGPPVPVTEAFRTRVQLATSLGFHVALGKCIVCSAGAAVAATLVAEAVHVAQAQDGLLVAGSAVSTPAFEAAKANICADKACTLKDVLRSLGDQNRCLIL
jgi:hypothetical protein